MAQLMAIIHWKMLEKVFFFHGITEVAINLKGNIFSKDYLLKKQKQNKNYILCRKCFCFQR